MSARWTASASSISASISLDRWRRCCWPIRAPRSSASTHRWAPLAASRKCRIAAWQAQHLLDLKRSNDFAIARDLVASADVVIENFRPRVMERLGLGPLATSERHPRLIFCSLPGFAADDPRAGLAG